MSVNTLDIIGRTYDGSSSYFGDTEDVVVGGVYAVARDYDAPKIVVVRDIYEGNRRHAMINGRAYRTGLLNNPATKVGDYVNVYEVVEGAPAGWRKDRAAEVIKITDDGILVKQGRLARFTATFWTLHSDTPKNNIMDRRDPRRRQHVIDTLTSQGMRRIGDTGYATSAREFFDKFDLPHPPVHPTAQVDVEIEVKYNDMGYDMRDMFDRKGITSLRVGVLKGRSKVQLPKSDCRCKEITFDEVKEASKANGKTIVGGKLHGVQCMWCVPISDIEEVASRE